MGITVIQPARAVTLQNAYDGGTAPEIVTDPSRGPLTLTSEFNPEAGGVLPPVLRTRVDVIEMGVVEGLSISATGLTSGEDIEIQPAPAEGISGKRVRISGGDSDTGRGGNISIQAGSGATPGRIDIGTDYPVYMIESGSVITEWRHKGDLAIEGSAQISKNATVIADLKIQGIDLGTGETALLVSYDSGSGFRIERVTVGAEDSGGPGYRALRVPN